MTLDINRVYQMDCIEGMKQMEENSVDLVIADPPYYIENLQKDLSKHTLRGSSKNNIFHDEFDKQWASLDDYKKWIYEVLTAINHILKPRGQVYLFCSYSHLHWKISFIKTVFKFYKPLIWYKPDIMGVFPNQYGCNYEPILWFSKRKNQSKQHAKFRMKNHIGVTQRDVFTFSSTLNSYRKECGYHPTPKPVSLIRQLIKNSSDEEDLVFDPFMGSGTTAVAAKSVNRNFLGFEINPEYIQIINKRLSQSTLTGRLNEFVEG